MPVKKRANRFICFSRSVEDVHGRRKVGECVYTPNVVTLSVNWQPNAFRSCLAVHISVANIAKHRLTLPNIHYNELRSETWLPNVCRRKAIVRFYFRSFIHFSNSQLKSFNKIKKTKRNQQQADIHRWFSFSIFDVYSWGFSHTPSERIESKVSMLQWKFIYVSHSTKLLHPSSRNRFRYQHSLLRTCLSTRMLFVSSELWIVCVIITFHIHFGLNGLHAWAFVLWLCDFFFSFLLVIRFQ